MTWVLVDVAVVLLALVALGLTGFGLYRRARALGRDVTAAGDRVSALSAQLETLSAPRPAVAGAPALPARAQGRGRRPGVR